MPSWQSNDENSDKLKNEDEFSTCLKTLKLPSVQFNDSHQNHEFCNNHELGKNFSGFKSSKTLEFPNDSQGFCATGKKLFEGQLGRNSHSIFLTLPGFYAIQLINLTESTWDSLYLGIGRTRIVAEFDVIAPENDAFSNFRNTSSDAIQISSHNESSLENNGFCKSTTGKKTTGAKFLQHNTNKDKLGGPSASHSEVTSFEESCSDLDSLPFINRALCVSCAHSNKTTLVNETTVTKEISRASCNFLWKEKTYENNTKTTAFCFENEVIQNKGRISAKARQEKSVYFYNSKPKRLLKLQVYLSSFTWGRHLKCSYSIMYCGLPRINPNNAIVPFQHRINILSLDGGGILGLSSLKILERLELELQKKLKDPDARLSDCFDMICGTSTGGIISLGLLRGISIKEMIDIWASMSEQIFEGNRNLFSGIFFEGYDTTKLKEVMLRSLGFKFMNTFSKPYCFVTATNVKLNPYELFLLRNYSHHNLASTEYRGFSSIPLWAAAWATSAAPTYLRGPQPEELKNMGFLIHPEVQLCDGALKANNPTMIALQEAARLDGKTLQHFVETGLDILVSVGTGQPTLRQTIEKSGNVSTFQILVNSAHLLTSATAVHREVLRWIGASQDCYFRFNVPNIGDIRLDSCERRTYDLIVKATSDYLIDEKYYDINRLAEKLAFRYTCKNKC